MQKKKIVTALIVIATIILAGVAVFTAYRLYQLRQESIAPTAPESKPEAAAPQTEACDQLAFSLGTSTSSPTATPTDTPTNTPTNTPTPTSTPTPATGTSTPAPASGTATPKPSLPDAGVSFPTIVSAGLGILIILGSLVLIF